MDRVQLMPPHGPRVIGTRHMASSANFLAAQAAFAVLEAGGNAIDAGVAGGIVLGVVQGEFVHFAGVAPMIIHLAATGETFSISGLGGWPRAASADYFHRHHGGRIPPGIMRTVVPAAPDAWITALERFGTISFAEAARIAIGLAREGFATQSITSDLISRHAGTVGQWPSSAAIYLPGGAPPKAGDRFFQTDLAASIQYMADQELAASQRGGRLAGLAAARDAFYRGDIARKIVAYHADNGGWLAAEDLATFRSDVETPPSIRYGDTQVFGCGAWCQGPVLLQTLKLLEGMDLASLGHNSPAYVHRLTEALKLCFADREHHIGDPKFIDVPLSELLSDSYAAHRRTMIDDGMAYPGMPPAGSMAKPHSVGLNERPADLLEVGLDTSYICVVDQAGNCFSATPSDGCLDGPVIPGTGIAPSSRGMQSWTDPTHPSCLAPGKRPRLTPNPALAIRDGRWFMPFGTPGADVQPQAMLQVFLNISVFGMSPQEAIEQPRFATFSFPSSSDPHPYYPRLVKMERRFPDSVADRLTAMGHEVAWWSEWEYEAGAVCTILADRQTGLMEGGADRRRPGGVSGW